MNWGSGRVGEIRGKNSKVLLQEKNFKGLKEKGVPVENKFKRGASETKIIYDNLSPPPRLLLVDP